MSDEVVIPQDILEGDVKEQLVEAIIDAYMAKGAEESGATNLRFKPGGKDGSGGSRTYKYEFEVSGAGNPEVECRYPSGEWVQTKKLWWDKGDLEDHPYVDAGDNSYEITVFDAPAVWSEIRDLVDSWVDPWVNDCPSPHVFTNQITSMARVAAQLYAGAGPNATVSGTEPSAPDQDLRNSLSQLGISGDGESLAMDLFQQTYAADIWTTVGGQQALAYAAGLALTAEAVAWNASYKSLRDFLKVATSDFASFAGSHDGSGGGTDAALLATGAVASLLSATAGKAWPPFGAAMSVVSGGIGVYRAVNKPVPPVSSTSLVLTGGSFAEMIESFKDQIKKIHTDLKDAETAIADSCTAWAAQPAQSPDLYSLTRGMERRRQGPGDDFTAMYGRRLDLVDEKLRKLAGACEAIADHLTGLAAIVGGSDRLGNPTAIAHDDWYRGFLPEVGVIGSAYTGPFADYAALVNVLGELLIEDGRTSHRVAEWILDMLVSVHLTDAEVETRLDHLAEPFDANPFDPIHARPTP